MDKEKILAERKELMERLADSFQDDLFPAMINEPRDPDNPDEPVIMSVIFDEMGRGDQEAFGEFCFRPFVTDEDDVQFFAAVITISDDLDKDYLPALVEAISYANFLLPAGAFSVDFTHSFLCYRLAAPLPSALSGDALYEEMNVVAGTAVALADSHFSLLLDVSTGKTTVDEVVELLGGHREEEEE